MAERAQRDILRLLGLVCAKLGLMDRWCAVAAINNAEWCDVVSRSHHAKTRFADDAWTSRTRTPPYYPDAVTLVPSPSVPDMLSRIDVSSGCSIKDSFAALDLRGYGFRVLFEGHWIVRTPSPSAAQHEVFGWKRVVDPDGLASWEEAWRGQHGPQGLFRPELLDNDSVVLLARYVGERVVAGGVLNRSPSVVGVSNVFPRSGREPEGWSGCVAVAASIFSAETLVGYESGDGLIAARRNGFQTVGPLRVWVNGG